MFLYARNGLRDMKKGFDLKQNCTTFKTSDVTRLKKVKFNCINIKLKILIRAYT